MMGVAERGRPQLYFDTNFITVSQKLAELYSSASFLCFTFCRWNPSQPCIHNACVCNPIVLYLLSVTALQKDEGLLPFGDRFLDEIFVQNFKWRVSHRGADLRYILIPIILLSLKNWLSYTARHHFMLSGFYCRSNPSHIFIMRVYTILLYCTCSVKTRATSLRRPCIHNACVYNPLLSVNIRPFVQNLKWRVSQRGADVSYILIQLLLLYLKNLLSYTAWHNYFQAFIAVQILPSHICHNACVYNAFVLYLLSVTALQKDEGCFPSATVF